MKLSVIIPVFNEGEGVRFAHDAIVNVLREKLPEMDFELIYVDDGSHDDTFAHLTTLSATYPYVRAIKFLVNCGSHMAIRAGLEHADGDIACFIACDLQDPPELIPEMLEKLIGPVQVVWAVRHARQDSLSSQLFSKAFYGLVRLLVSKNFPPSGSSMFLLGPDALKAVRLYKERNLTLEGLFSVMGFRQAFIGYDRQARKYGKSKWTMAKRLKLFADFFVGYSYTPIRLMSYIGMIVASLGFLYAIIVLINRLFFYNPVQGYASLLVIVLVVGGIQMIMMGITGEYIWRTLDEVRSRPRYMIECILNEAQNENDNRKDKVFHPGGTLNG
jgi:glycosyltransferase involved in cell wall biosynthesis